MGEVFTICATVVACVGIVMLTIMDMVNHYNDLNLGNVKDSITERLELLLESDLEEERSFELCKQLLSGQSGQSGQSELSPILYHSGSSEETVK